jgi:hypothetical protein
MSRDNNEKINGFIIIPPEGLEFLAMNETPGEDEYSGLLKDNKFIVLFTGIAYPQVLG